MFDVVVRPQADNDLIRIWVDIAINSETAATRIVDDVVDHFRLIAKYPEIAPYRDDLGPTLRALVVRRYLVIYQIESALDEIHILRILEGERDLTDLF
jgi:toxin ParE1/3/4